MGTMRDLKPYCWRERLLAGRGGGNGALQHGRFVMEDVIVLEPVLHTGLTSVQCAVPCKKSKVGDYRTPEFSSQKGNSFPQ